MYKVMIVDDERPVRAGLIESVRWADVDCEEAVEAGNGAEALRLMEQSLPDVALIDLEMPVMGGMELIREIRRRGWPVDVIILTCHADFACAQEAIRLGVFDYVLKLSASGEGMLEALRRVLMRRLQRQGAPELADAPKNAGPGAVLALQVECASSGYDGAYAVYRALTFGGGREHCVCEGRMAQCYQLQGDGLAILFPGKRPEDLVGVAQRLLECVRRHTGRDAAAGLSDFFSDCDARAVAQAHSRAQLGFYLGCNRVYATEALPENWNDSSELLNPVDLLAMDRDDMEVLRSVRGALPKLRGRKPELARAGAVEWLYALSVRARRKGRALVDPLTDLKQISRHMERLGSFDGLQQEVLCATEELTEQEAISRLSEAVKRTTQMVRRHPEGGESLMEIARSIGCSYCYLSSQFKLEMGVGFSEFRNRLRVQQAMTMLTETEQSIVEIAEKLGYSSPYYFSAAFKRVTGLAPASYRAMHADGADEARG